jgi:xanthine dehydrogenase accessory factor
MEKHFYKKLIEFDFNESCALCTVMEWKGSVPRKDYPMMLVCKSGETVGTIGGGTMEKEVIERALDALNSNQTSLDPFDFTNNDLSKDGGLCGGTVQVAVEPFTREVQSFFNQINDFNTEQSWLTTFHLSSKEISRQNIKNSGQHEDPFIQELTQIRKNKSFHFDDCIQLFRFISPNPILHIFGGGHVGKAVAEMAHYIELDITIHDDRKSFISLERFPYALNRSFQEVDMHMGGLKLQSTDLALVATRGHHHDLTLIRWLLKSDIRWIGLVSSKRKWKLLAKGLLDEGFTNTDLSRVYAPVGIYIHAQTVPEIAVSIIGGIIKYLRN